MQMVVKQDSWKYWFEVQRKGLGQRFKFFVYFSGYESRMRLFGFSIWSEIGFRVECCGVLIFDWRIMKDDFVKEVEGMVREVGRKFCMFFQKIKGKEILVFSDGVERLSEVRIGNVFQVSDAEFLFQ